MLVKGYELCFEPKVERALNGSPDQSGNNVGGVAKPDGSYDEDALLAEYDRIGGLIRKGGDKVRMGAFYDFKAKKPRIEPRVEFIFRVNDKEVIVPEGTELPGVVKAARILKQAEDDEEEPKPKKLGRPKKNERTADISA